MSRRKSRSDPFFTNVASDVLSGGNGSAPEAVFLADRILVMSERPGSIAAVYDVPLPRPRSLDVMADPVFVELTQAIRRHFNPQRTDELNPPGRLGAPGVGSKGR
jgi:hypothetical protein